MKLIVSPSGSRGAGLVYTRPSLRVQPHLLPLVPVLPAVTVTDSEEGVEDDQLRWVHRIQTQSLCAG